MNNAIEVVEADLMRSDHQQAVRALTLAYALDPMGKGGPLAADALDRLIPGLKAHPTTLILLACVDEEAVGIATCFRGFSTFFALPLVNIHDLAVLPAFRGRGIGRRLLDAVAEKARALGSCKVTLEVQENNTRARHVYEAAGFAQATSGETAGGGLFYSRALRRGD